MDFCILPHFHARSGYAAWVDERNTGDDGNRDQFIPSARAFPVLHGSDNSYGADIPAALEIIYLDGIGFVQAGAFAGSADYASFNKVRDERYMDRDIPCGSD